MLKLILTEEQAGIVANACEFYARIRMGQFNELVWQTMDMRVHMDDYCTRRDEAERLLLEARRQIYPELVCAGHSYGIGKFEDADKSFDVYQVLRYALGDERRPFSYHELPKVERMEEDGK